MPDIALFKIGPLRQYELTNAACQISSISLGSRPITNGFRYCSTAVTTASGRWVKVAHPRPYRPGSLVSTFTTTRRMPSGAVQIVLTLVILSAGMPPDGSQAGGMAGWIESGVGVSGMGSVPSRGEASEHSRNRCHDDRRQDDNQRASRLRR